MQSDTLRVLAVLAFGLFIGALVDYPLAGLLLAALAYIFWYHQQMEHLVDWIHEPRQREAPEISGVMEDACSEITLLRDRHRSRKRKLATVIKQFQEATMALPDATVIVGREGEITWANKAATEYLGIRWPEDRHQRLVNLLRHPLAGELLAGKITDARSAVEIPAPNRENTYLSLQVVPYTEDQRLFVARDVTRLHRLNLMRRDFVANVSHELRTPLTVIRGYIEALQADKQKCPPEWQPLLAQVEEHSQRMSAVIRDLLLLSRLEQSDEQAPREPLAVANMLGRILAEAQQVSGDARHMFSLEAEADLYLLGVESEIYSAFSNLIINAVLYTPARGLIQIRWARNDHGAQLSVTDNGMGIAAVHIPRLTERFYRVDKSRARDSGGTGLGLAIVNHVLQRHEASLHITSAPGEGSVFRCDFPAARVQFSPAEEAAARDLRSA